MEESDNTVKDTKAFCDFYIDFIHNYSERSKFFLSDEVILDYFGVTVKGQKNVSNFIKSKMTNTKHLFHDAKPVEKIGFRDTHIIKLPKISKKTLPIFFSPQKSSSPKTPTKRPLPSTSNGSKEEKGQGDGNHNYNSFVSPPKKIRLTEAEDSVEDNELIEAEAETTGVKYLLCEGSLEFRRPSGKKLQMETKWQRPCKLSVAYTAPTPQESMIYLIIYEGNVKCRRNLMKDFLSEDPKN